MKSIYDASSELGLRSFWRALLCNYLDTEQGKRTFLVKVVRLGLMTPSNVVTYVAFWAVQKFKGELGLVRLMEEIARKHPSMIDDFIEDIRRHVFTGRDHEEPDVSFGGWSQREIDLLTRELHL